MENVQNNQSTVIDKANWKNRARACFIIAFIPFIVGFYKLWVYVSPDSLEWDETPINAYVGADAYNYIINAGQACAYFILGGILVAAAMGCLIINEIKKNHSIY